MAIFCVYFKELNCYEISILRDLQNDLLWAGVKKTLDILN
jgi:hypothetical protein